MNDNGITVVRIGDQVLFQSSESGKRSWFVAGYYQLREIADMYGDRLSLFTAFGRIMDMDGDVGHFYRIPAEVVHQFAAAGPRIARKGIIAYLCRIPSLIWKARRVTTTHDVSWLMLPSLAGVVGSLVAPKRTVKVVQLEGEGAASLRLRYPRLAFLVVPLAECLIRLALRRADLAVFVSDHLKRRYGHGIRGLVIVAGDVRLRPWMIREVTNRDEVHSPFRVLYTGRLVPEKGVQFLLEAIARLSKEMSCELWLGGRGSYEPALRALAKKLGIMDSIRWLGWVPWGQELFQRMSKADVLVLPSLTEGLPLVLIEAMSQCLPVIASRVGGTPEIVMDGVSGILIEPGNSLALARAIRQVSTDTELRQKLVAEGLRIAEKNTVEAQTGRVIEAICQLAETEVGS
ncbi:glycosyltransferase family 4 protein [Candidatus Bipolaricaulota bacterium]